MDTLIGFYPCVFQYRRSWQQKQAFDEACHVKFALLKGREELNFPTSWNTYTTTLQAEIPCLFTLCQYFWFVQWPTYIVESGGIYSCEDLRFFQRFKRRVELDSLIDIYLVDIHILLRVYMTSLYLLILFEDECCISWFVRLERIYIALWKKIGEEPAKMGSSASKAPPVSSRLV